MELVLALKPLRSLAARMLLTVLAHHADTDGDCGPITRTRLAEMTGCTPRSIDLALRYLEETLGLITKIEQVGTTPTRFLLHTDRLRSPSAHLPKETRTVKAVGGPLAGMRLSPPDVNTGKCRKWPRNNGPLPQRPVLYRYAPDERAGRLHTAITLTYHTDGLTHIYRLGIDRWIYSGVCIETLAAYGLRAVHVARLRAVDVHTVEELDHAVRAWRRHDPDGDAYGFIQHLRQAEVTRMVAGEEDRLTDQVVATILDVHRCWERDPHRPGGRGGRPEPLPAPPGSTPPAPTTARRDGDGTVHSAR